MAPPASRPRRLPFTLQPDETVLLFARRHIVFVTWKLVREGIFALVPIAALLVLAALTFGLDGTAGRVVAIVCLLWFVVFAVRSYFVWFRYHNDLWVVTDQRIIDSTRRHWFHHAMASADLDDVEDMKIRKEGIFPTMFNYGDVRLQTAGEQPNFTLSGIPRPNDVMALVDRQRDAAKKRLRGLPH